METNLKKLFAVIMTLCMVFTIFAIGPTAQATTYKKLEINKAVSGTGDNYYSLKAETSGTYTFEFAYDDGYFGECHLQLFESTDLDWAFMSYYDFTNNHSFVTPLEKGKTYYLYVYSYEEESYTVKVPTPVTIKKFECTKNPFSYIEEDANTGYFYHYKTYNGKEKKFFYYSPDEAVNEATFKITYSNGTTETFKGGDYSLKYDTTQSYKKPWKKGGKNEITVKYNGVETTFSAKIKKSDIKSIKVVDTNDFVYYEKNEIFGDWLYDEEVDKSYFYYSPWHLLYNTTLKVTYKNGKTKYVDYNDELFQYAEIDYKQDYDNQWKKGGKNKITINIQGAEATLNAKIVKNTLPKDFEYTYQPYMKTVYIKKYLGKAKSGIKIPEEVKGIKVETVNGYAFSETAYAKNTKNWKNGGLYVGDWLIYVETDKESFTVKDGTKHIAESAFDGAVNLKKLTIPASVNDIGYNDVYDIEKITFKGSPDKWNNITGSLDIGSEDTTIKCTGKACKHNWEWKTEKAATKYIKGVKYKECSKCFTRKEGSEKETTGIAKAKISGIKDKTYTGKALKQSLKLKIGSKTLKENTDYTVSYKNNKKVGTATITIKGKGDYAGKVTKTFKITPVKTSVKKVVAGKKSLKVTVKKKTTQVSGYQIQYSTSKSFSTKYTKTKTIKSYKTTTVTLKGLKAKKTYYVRVRTFKTVDGKKVYSAWSTKKTKKTK